MRDDPKEKSGTQHIPFEQIIRWLTEQQRLAHYGEDRPGLTDARQPEQPKSGPGGCAYPHAGVRTNLYGKGSVAYWTFEPTDPSPASASLIVLLHGWGGGSPARLGAWIDHLVKRGNVVVFPAYQGSLRPWSRPWDQVPAAMMLENVIAAVKDAIHRLQAEGHARLALDRFAITGLSLGGALTTQVAAGAAKAGLPTPKAIMPVAPGRGLWARRALPPGDLRNIPPTVLMLVVVCEEDKNAGDYEGKVVFTQTSQIPAENKNLIVVASDYHGTPPLVTNHSSATAFHPAYQMASFPNDDWLHRSMKPMAEQPARGPNALHYYAYWKLFDGLVDAAFDQRNREYALGNTPEQRFMGIWSDGVPVKELRVITHPDVVPRRQFPKTLRTRRWLLP